MSRLSMNASHKMLLLLTLLIWPSIILKRCLDNNLSYF